MKKTFSEMDCGVMKIPWSRLEGTEFKWNGDRQTEDDVLCGRQNR